MVLVIFVNNHTIPHYDCNTGIVYGTYVAMCHHVEKNSGESFDCVIISNRNNINSC